MLLTCRSWFKVASSFPFNLRYTLNLSSRHERPPFDGLHKFPRIDCPNLSRAQYSFVRQFDLKKRGAIILNSNTV